MHPLSFYRRCGSQVFQMIRHEHQLDSSALNRISSLFTSPSFSFATFSIYCFVWTYTRYSSSSAARASSFARVFSSACSRGWCSRSRSLREAPPIWTTTARLRYDHRDPDQRHPVAQTVSRSSFVPSVPVFSP